MNSEIERLIARLRTSLASASTETIANYVSSLQKMQSFESLTAGLGLSSPMRQLFYAMGLTLTTPEPAHDQFGDIQGEIAPLLEAIQEQHIRPFLDPRKNGKYIESQVGFGAFARTFFVGRFVSIPQLRRRISIALSPFDTELKAAWGFDTSEALRIADSIQQQLQDVADRLNALISQRQSAILMPAGREALAGELARVRRDLATWACDLPYPTVFRKTGGALDAFLRVFAISRGDSTTSFTYFDDSNPYERHPIIWLPGKRISVPVTNQLYFAILDRGIETIISSASAQGYYAARGGTLESETLAQMKKLLPSAEFHSPVYEAPGTNEHDILILLDDVVVVVECKSSPPSRAIRDPAKAYTRLRDKFKSSVGVQHGFSQANKLLKRFTQATTPFTLFDRSRGAISIDPAKYRRFYSIVVTLEEFGILGTDVTMLLEKHQDEEFPWVVALPDLESFAEMLVDVRAWGGEVFLDWLEERRDRMGDFITDDELEIAGIFLRYGTLSVFPRGFKIFGIREQAQMFDDIARARFLGEAFALPDDPEPPEQTEVPEEVKKKIAARHRSAEMKVVSRNDPCPCGSGKKFKRCHGAQ